MKTLSVEECGYGSSGAGLTEALAPSGRGDQAMPALTPTTSPRPWAVRNFDMTAWCIACGSAVKRLLTKMTQAPTGAVGACVVERVPVYSGGLLPLFGSTIGICSVGRSHGSAERPDGPSPSF